ncbi:hypothetical protein TWF102_004946 [Orbilia oligospora]|uniref:Mid2 domain-containing protein n=1 Tax=Orbilia oligospora TaxID=2813651 RepID=A0A7C8NHD0_ORBOL|nr:hypothetical protein TWF103_000947 [Orbilia oligospora]KAF3101134.1 hypothetical protein TWF102_004946 [Orbilia oligospora]
MKPLISCSLLFLMYLISLSIAQDIQLSRVKRYEHDVDNELIETDPPLTSTVIFDDVDTSHTAPTDKGGSKTSPESFIEPTDSVSESTEPPPSETPKPTKPGASNSDTDDSPPPLTDSDSDSNNSTSTSNSTSKKPTGKLKPSSSSSSAPPEDVEEQPPETTTAFFQKLVKVHINPTQAQNYPTKPTNYPPFADYEQGIVYVKGIPHQILAADTNYNRLKQAEDDIGWEEADKKDDKQKQEELEQELEHQDRLVAGGDGHVIYSADVTSGEENAVKKAVFFSVIAAGIITIGLLAFFGVF